MAQDKRELPASDQGELFPSQCQVQDWRVWPESMIVMCCRCGRDIRGMYWLTDSASPAHWDCLTEDEKSEREVYI